jgi:hypothetical protein
MCVSLMTRMEEKKKKHKLRQLVRDLKIWQRSRMMVTNQNLIHDEIKTRLIFGYVYHHSVQKLLSSHVLSKNVKIKIISFVWV